MKEKTSIIGFGNFGKLMAENLKDKLELVVTDVSNKEKEAEKLGLKFVSLDEALQSKIIILSIPMEIFEEFLFEIKDKIRKNSIVLDVCSLKMFSCEAMKKILPKTIEIIGTHPLFGPQSVKRSRDNLKIVLSEVRSKKETFESVRNFCEKDLGLNVFIKTPKEHDKEMAVSQALTHFIGQVVKKSKIKRVELTTQTFESLMDVMDIIANDTKALFENMETMNPFAKEMRDNFVKEARKLNERLNKIQN